MLPINFNPFPTLITNRLKLRQVNADDVNEIFFLRSDKTVLQFLDKEPEASIETASVFIKKLNELEKNNESINWAITFKDEKKLIGTICFWRLLKEHHRAEIGYVLHPNYQRKGIMQEAMTAVLDYGFKKMKLHSVEANVNPANTSSIKILEKNNFTREGYFKENYFFNGKFLDSAIYSLVTPER